MTTPSPCGVRPYCCPVHDAAPELLRSLKELLEEYEQTGGDAPTWYRAVGAVVKAQGADSREGNHRESGREAGEKMTDTEKRIGEIKDRAEKATKGPWIASPMADMGWPDLRDIVAKDGPAEVLGCRFDADDGAFVAHAREDIRWLLEQLDRARELVEDVAYLARRIPAYNTSEARAGDGFESIRKTLRKRAAAAAVALGSTTIWGPDTPE